MNSDRPERRENRAENALLTVGQLLETKSLKRSVVEDLVKVESPPKTSNALFINRFRGDQIRRTSDYGPIVRSFV